MAISVAPLTTVVMSSVGQDRAGTASGINHAVARVAGVLAVAILGIVMVKLFSSSLNRSLTGELLAPGILQYVRSNEIKLASLDLGYSPAGRGQRNDAKLHHQLRKRYEIATIAQSSFLPGSCRKVCSFFIHRAENDGIPIRIASTHISSGHGSGPIQT